MTKHARSMRWGLISCSHAPKKTTGHQWERGAERKVASERRNRTHTPHTGRSRADHSANNAKQKPRRQRTKGNLGTYGPPILASRSHSTASSCDCALFVPGLSTATSRHVAAVERRSYARYKVVETGRCSLSRQECAVVTLRVKHCEAG
jgi:hypothetical protein